MRSPIVAALVLALSACGHLDGIVTSRQESMRPADPRAHDVVMFALGLIDTGYRFGGKHPTAGLDCSGMVSYVYANAAGLNLAGSAADIARYGRSVDAEGLRPGDLVFFNTRGHPHSHVGIYIGNGRFIHAPNSNGKVRTESLTQGWFATRFEEARTYFD
ncbi:MAG: C40 family peptidase [Pseudomonadota bacterium]